MALIIIQGIFGENEGMELMGQGIRFFQEIVEMAKILPKNEEG